MEYPLYNALCRELPAYLLKADFHFNACFSCCPLFCLHLHGNHFRQRTNGEYPLIGIVD